MIVAGGTRDGRPMLLLAVTRENIDRLVAGDPILVTRERHGPSVPEDLQIAIMFGETEAAVTQVLRESGALTPKTTFVIGSSEHGH